MADEYIRREDAVDAMGKAQWAKDRLLEIEPADVVPYSIEPDGTLTVTVPQGIKVGRVLVQEDGTHCGGLYYAD